MIQAFGLLFLGHPDRHGFLQRRHDGPCPEPGDGDGDAHRRKLTYEQLGAAEHQSVPPRGRIDGALREQSRGDASPDAARFPRC